MRKLQRKGGLFLKSLKHSYLYCPCKESKKTKTLLRSLTVARYMWKWSNIKVGPRIDIAQNQGITLTQIRHYQYTESIMLTSNRYWLKKTSSIHLEMTHRQQNADLLDGWRIEINPLATPGQNPNFFFFIFVGKIFIHSCIHRFSLASSLQG